MKNSGKSKRMQAGMTTVIDEQLHLIEELEAETHMNQGIYDDFALKMKTRLEQRLQEAKDGV